VFSTDISILEEYLRMGKTPKSLSETPGLAETAQKGHRFRNGMVRFENKVETMRVVFEGLKKDPSPQ
jgi:hypothetical protein